MPSLVDKTEEGKTGGIWEVKWTWMPVFLAMDKSLVKAVDEKLNQLFAGGDPPMPGVLEGAVIDVICQRYPMSGLREALKALVEVDPTVRLHLVDEAPVPEDEVEMTTSTESEGASLSSRGSPKNEQGAKS